MLPLTGDKICISVGLEGQDDNWEKLAALYEDLGLCSLDLASQPEGDLLSFAQTAFLFGVITVRGSPKNPDPSEAQTTRASSSSQGSTLDDYRGPPEYTFLDTYFDHLRSPTWQPRPKSPENWFSDDDPDWNWGVPEPSAHQWGVGTADIVAKQSRLKRDLLAPVAETARPDNDFRSSKVTPALNWGVPETSAQQWGVGTADIATKQSRSKRALFAERPRPDNDFLSSKVTPFTSHTPLESYSNRTAVPPVLEELVAAVMEGPSPSVVGIIYLAHSPLVLGPPDQVGELNLGIIISEAHRGKGFAREAIQLVLQHAFEKRMCHRIQASLMSLSSKDIMTSLLTQLRFGHEGIRRRSFYNPLIQEWQDVTTLAMLDTDWAMRGVYHKPAPKSLWDEMFLRHERERDELLRWDDDQNRLKRSASMETLRAVPITPDPDPTCDFTASESDAGSVASRASVNKGKKRMAPPDWSHDRDPFADDGASSDADSEFDATFVRKKLYIADADRRSGASSPTLSIVSSVSSASLSPPGTPTPEPESDWDLMESSMSSSSSSSSNFGDDD
ncbi:hypothetical protein K438DRAFT_1971326 [Mycena galopus ATCC 62051]|nr:hypothetical protein K438DRAFT_1971326 [Mycena galopus ATCC 62051]